ncbi:MAG TPA: Clp1/GlmU family protein [Atribacterota bacterium]|nr:Clp1/GlmU family protein [Atribacterota bacterium]
MVNSNICNDELFMPGDWLPVIQKIQKHEGTVIVLGKTDSGKTSFIKLLTCFLVRRNRKIGIIDSDIGQSTLGPPATIGLSIADKNRLKDGIIPVDYIYFIGAISPEQCIDRFLDRIYRLYTIAEKEKIDVLLIDTTGLVMGRVGQYLKGNLIRKIHPSALVALQFDRELEPILSEFVSQSLIHTYRITPYPNIVERNWRDRKSRREKQFNLYFKGLQVKEIDFSTMVMKDFNFGLSFCSDNNIAESIGQIFKLEIIFLEVIGSRAILILPDPQNIPDKATFIKIKRYLQVEQVVLIFPHWFQNILASLNNAEGLSIGLGIVKRIDVAEKRNTFLVPASLSLGNIAQIELGKVRIKPDGTELPYREPLKY